MSSGLERVLAGAQHSPKPQGGHRKREAQRVVELQRNAVPPRSASDVAELVIAAIDTVGPSLPM